MAAKKKTVKKTLTREEELREKLFVALTPAVTMGWSREKVAEVAEEMAHDYLVGEGVIE